VEQRQNVSHGIHLSDLYDYLFQTSRAIACAATRSVDRMLIGDGKVTIEQSIGTLKSIRLRFTGSGLP